MVIAFLFCASMFFNFFIIIQTDLTRLTKGLLISRLVIKKTLRASKFDVRKVFFF